jgi:integrase
MARTREGGIVTRENGKIYARVTYMDEHGRKRQITRLATTRTEARKIIKRMHDEMEKVGERAVEADKMSFKMLADNYKSVKLQRARYVGERKVAGVRSLGPALAALLALVDYFGKRRVKTIKHSDIERYKLLRLDTPTIHNRIRSIASVNRELQLLRAILRFAIREGVLMRSPFELGAPLISISDERKRDRVLSFEEEARLLSKCTGRRAHILPLIITALDTGMRRGELFSLRWADVDLIAGIINIRATTTKTLQARSVGMTPRVMSELGRLCVLAPTDSNEMLVFGITNTIKTSFMAALREAGIEGLRFHDFRHTAITRMIEAGMPPAAVMKISGHTQMTTFARYVNPNADSARRGADMLAAFHRVHEVPLTVEAERIN